MRSPQVRSLQRGRSIIAKLKAFFGDKQLLLGLAQFTFERLGRRFPGVNLLRKLFRDLKANLLFTLPQLDFSSRL
jgi:hypothetical protein